MAPMVTVLAPQFHGDGDFLHLQVGGEDGVGGVQEAWGVSARAATREGTPFSMAWMFSSTPMMPVEQTAKSWGRRPVAGSGGLGHPLGVFPALGGAGVGVAAVKNDPPGPGGRPGAPW